MKVHPVSTSVMFTVRANSPLSTGPQWATVTGLEEPGLGLHWIAPGVVEGLNPWKDEDHARTQEVPR